MKQSYENKSAVYRLRSLQVLAMVSPSTDIKLCHKNINLQLTALCLHGSWSFSVHAKGWILFYVHRNQIRVYHLKVREIEKRVRSSEKACLYQKVQKSSCN